MISGVSTGSESLNGIGLFDSSETVPSADASCRAAIEPAIGVMAALRACCHCSRVSRAPVTSANASRYSSAGRRTRRSRRRARSRPPTSVDAEPVLADAAELREHRQPLVEVVVVEGLVAVEEVDIHRVQYRPTDREPSDRSTIIVPTWLPSTTARSTPNSSPACGWLAPPSAAASSSSSPPTPSTASPPTRSTPPPCSACSTRRGADVSRLRPCSSRASRPWRRSPRSVPQAVHRPRRRSSGRAASPSCCPPSRRSPGTWGRPAAPSRCACRATRSLSNCSRRPARSRSRPRTSPASPRRARRRRPRRCSATPSRSTSTGERPGAAYDRIDGKDSSSTIVDATALAAGTGPLRILRHGVISEEQIRAIVGDQLAASDAADRAPTETPSDA